MQTVLKETNSTFLGDKNSQWNILQVRSEFEDDGNFLISDPPHQSPTLSSIFFV